MGMNKRLLGRMVGLTVLLMLLFTEAVAESPLFSAAALRDYAASTPQVAMTENGQTPWAYWQYAMESQGDWEGLPGNDNQEAPFLRVLVTGSGEDGYPSLGLRWTDAQQWRAQAVALQAGDRVYLIQIGSSDSFFHCARQERNRYAYSLLIPLGGWGPELLHALRNQSFRLCLRVADQSRVRLAAQWDGSDAYDAFYQGLVASHYLDETGVVQRSLWDGLAMIDDIAYYPQIAAYPKANVSWQENDPTAMPVPQAASLLPTRPMESANLTLLRQCDCIRSGDAITLRANVRSNASSPVVSVTFRCYLQYNEDIVLFSPMDTPNLLEAAAETSIQPGHRKQVSLRFRGVGEAKAALLAIREVVYADGTRETVSPRDMTFLRCPLP